MVQLFWHVEEGKVEGKEKIDWKTWLQMFLK
jgi:hypothetical protein